MIEWQEVNKNVKRPVKHRSPTTKVSKEMANSNPVLPTPKKGGKKK